MPTGRAGRAMRRMLEASEPSPSGPSVVACGPSGCRSRQWRRRHSYRLRVARERAEGDWSRDRLGARPTEAVVLAALRGHEAVSLVADFTDETDASDFRFRFEGDDVRLELKEKLTVLTDGFADLWPEVPRGDLMVVDEMSFRRLVWAEGVGYLLVRDVPGGRWCTFGPWELCLGPRRRFERWGNKGAGPFLKGKLLLDLRTAATASSGLDLDLDEVLGVVRSSRRALRQVSAFRLRMEGDIPEVPKRADTAATPGRRPVPSPPVAQPDPWAEAPKPMRRDTVDEDPDVTWAGLSRAMAAELRARGWSVPTPVQEGAIPAVLAGKNVLVLGPTAGGKTEAAALPLLDGLHRHPPGRRPVILVVNPLTALLIDQRDRWCALGAMVGASCFAWFGESDQASRKAFKASPTDVLLTTPESLEHLLSSATTDERALLGGLRAVVVDEVHAFVGTPRGAQLASLLERLDRFADDDLQRGRPVRHGGQPG